MSPYDDQSVSAGEIADYLYFLNPTLTTMNEALTKAGQQLNAAAAAYQHVGNLETAHLDPLQRPALLVLHRPSPGADTSSHVTGASATLAYMLGQLAVDDPAWLVLLETAVRAARGNR